MIVEVSEVISASMEEVWMAITDPLEMRKWYFEKIPDFKPEPGFETSFIMDSGERLFTATWRITEVIPGSRITCVWSYEEYPGEGPVTFILSAEGDKTRITVLNEGLDTFPQEIPEFHEESCRSGWEYFIQSRLPEYFERRRV